MEEDQTGEGADPSRVHRDIARWTRAVAVFTFCLVVVSAIADWFIYEQYTVANAGQKDTREQLKAVVAQLGGTQQVLLSPPPESKLLADKFYAHFQNMGGTRTAWFKGWISAHYFDGASPPNNLDLSKPYSPIDLSNAATVIAAGAPFDLGPASIFGDDVVKLFNRQGVGLVWGQAEYADIFEPDKPHKISFCLLVTMPVAAASTATPTAPSDAKAESAAATTNANVLAASQIVPMITQYRSDCHHSF